MGLRRQCRERASGRDCATKSARRRSLRAGRLVADDMQQLGIHSLVLLVLAGLALSSAMELSEGDRQSLPAASSNAGGECVAAAPDSGEGPTCSAEGMVVGWSRVIGREYQPEVVAIAELGERREWLGASSLEPTGAWSIEDIAIQAQGKLCLRLQGQGVVPMERILAWPNSGESCQCVFELALGERFRVFVKDTGLDPVPAAEIVVDWMQGVESCTSGVLATLEGSAWIDNAPRGDVWVSASAPGFTRVRAGPFLVPTDTEKTICIYLGRARVLQGSCTHAGEPVQDFTLQYWTGRPWNVQRLDFVGRVDGSFEVLAAPEGDAFLIGTSPLHPQSAVLALAAGESVAAALELPAPARALGRVVDRATGAPIAQASVQVFTCLGSQPLAPWMIFLGS